MVHGIDVFRTAFAGFSENYVLIGGTASDMILNLEGVPFRATKDIDIVLVVENLTPEFAKAFWAFVEAGGYKVFETKQAEPKYYRFLEPTNKEYPFMLELLSRVPDGIDYDRPGVITPIPVDDTVESLSAILLNDEYYGLIIESKVLIDGVPVVSKDALIQLKARAWMDLSDRRANGEVVKGDDIRKHVKDVIRFFATLRPKDTNQLEEGSIKVDMTEFLSRLGKSGIILGDVVPALKGVPIETMVERMSGYFGMVA
jgi:hypothetical protein